MVFSREIISFCILRMGTSEATAMPLAITKSIGLFSFSPQMTCFKDFSEVNQY